MATSELEIPECVFPVLIQQQLDLAKKYSSIEERNGHYHPAWPPPSLENGRFQAWIKDMFWRTTEEVAEAIETIPNFTEWRERWDQDSDVRHFFEELADAVHFLAEATAYVNMDLGEEVERAWDAVQGSYEAGKVSIEDGAELKVLCMDFVRAMGLAANCLKNKPWKTTQMLTDVARFNKNLLIAWSEFAHLWCGLGCTKGDVYLLYFRKNAVNQFRQRSNY